MRGVRVQQCEARVLFSYGISLHRGLPRSMRAMGVHGDSCKALLRPNSFPIFQLFFSQIIKNEERFHLSLSVAQRLAHTPAGTRWAGALFLCSRWGDVPTRAQSGAGVEGRWRWCWCTQDLKRLTDSSLKLRPWSWFRCETEAAHRVRLGASAWSSPAHLIGMTYDAGERRETGWFISLQIVNSKIWQ